MEVILNMRYSDSQSKERISNVVKKGQDGSKLLSALHLDTVSESNIWAVNLVVTNILSHEELRVLGLCSYCTEYLIITEDFSLTHEQVAKYIRRKVLDQAQIHVDHHI